MAALDPAPRLVVLDLVLPDGSGLDLLQRLRTEGCMAPVLIVSARDTVADRVAVVGISTDGDPASGNAAVFAGETGAAYPVVLDPGNGLAGRLSVDALPWCVLLDAEGRVRWQGPEPPPADRLPGGGTSARPERDPQRALKTRGGASRYALGFPREARP